MRNDIYVTLLQGEFDRGKKKTPKNVEVILSVHDDEGNPMEVKKLFHWLQQGLFSFDLYFHFLCLMGQNHHTGTAKEQLQPLLM